MNKTNIEINEIFENKKVIIVGPANNLIGLNKGDFIDSFDIVCRLNDSYIISDERQKDYGKRCDILLNTCNCQLLCIMNRYRDYLKECKLVINPTSCVHKQDYINTKKNVYNNYLTINLNVPFYQVTGKYEQNMTNKGLNTGLCSLDFLLNGVNLNSLYICGFSFHGCKDNNYIVNKKVMSYDTYLFDSKVVYSCNCLETSPCKKRVDNKYSWVINELKLLEFFKNNIVNHQKAIIDDTILKLL